MADKPLLGDVIKTGVIHSGDARIKVIGKRPENRPYVHVKIYLGATVLIEPRQMDALCRRWAKANSKK
jgi:phage gp37-like protein